MSNPSSHAYSRKQWFWAVNLIALFTSIGMCAAVFRLDIAYRILTFFPWVLLACLAISWIFIAWPLRYAMRYPASWLRAGAWGFGTATFITLTMFMVSTWQSASARLNALSDDAQGDRNFLREAINVLTSYNWSEVITYNGAFIALGTCVALAVRAIIGPGKQTS